MGVTINLSKILQILLITSDFNRKPVIRFISRSGAQARDHVSDVMPN